MASGRQFVCVILSGRHLAPVSLVLHSRLSRGDRLGDHRRDRGAGARGDDRPDVRTQRPGDRAPAACGSGGSRRSHLWGRVLARSIDNLTMTSRSDRDSGRGMERRPAPPAPADSLRRRRRHYPNVTRGAGEFGGRDIAHCLGEQRVGPAARGRTRTRVPHQYFYGRGGCTGARGWFHWRQVSLSPVRRFTMMRDFWPNEPWCRPHVPQSCRPRSNPSP